MPTNPSSSWLLIAAALLAGVLGTDAAWVALAVALGTPCSWMALVAAIDIVALLRLTGARPGATRVVLAVLATAVAVALAQWLTVATHVGLLLGLQPVDAARRLGPVLAGELLRLSLGPADFAWMALSLPLAALLARRNRRERADAARA